VAAVGSCCRHQHSGLTFPFKPTDGSWHFEDGIVFLCAPLHGRAMIYVLGYPDFAPSCRKRIDEFRARHEPERADLVPPHMTFVFGVAERHLNSVSALVDTASSRFSEFTVSFDTLLIEFDPFESKYKIFLLCGAGYDDAVSLHQHLYDGAHRSELSLEHPFRPHMTVATADKRAEIEEVDVSQVGKLPLKGRLRALEVVRLKDGRLTTLRSAPLSA